METEKTLFNFVQEIEGLKVKELEILKNIIFAKIKYLQAIDKILAENN